MNRYTLPDGCEASNMKEACSKMNITSHTFRRLMKKRIINTIELNSHDKQDNI